MTAPNPARNAMKHGFCSSHFVAAENADRVHTIRQELVASYQPALAEEFEIIAELALARLKVFENDKLMHQRAVEEKRQAARIFSDQALAAHQRTVAEWRKNPALHLSSLMTDPLGIDLLMGIWRELAAALQTESCTVTLAQACDAALALGSHWQIQRVGHLGRRVIGLYLALQANPEPEIEQWVDLSKGDNRPIDERLAHEIYSLSPSTDQARIELLELATAEIKELEALKIPVNQQFSQKQKDYAAKSCGLGLTDPTRQTEARLFLRYYYAEQNRADKLQRRLEQLNQGLNLHRKEKALQAMAEDLFMSQHRPMTSHPNIPDTSESTERLQDAKPAHHFKLNETDNPINRLDLSNTSLIGSENAQIIQNDLQWIAMNQPPAQPPANTQAGLLINLPQQPLRLVNPILPHAPAQEMAPNLERFARRA